MIDWAVPVTFLHAQQTRELSSIPAAAASQPRAPATGRQVSCSGQEEGGCRPAPPAVPGCSAPQPGGGGAALSRAPVEISPSVAGSAAEETPARAVFPYYSVPRPLCPPAAMSNYIHVPPGSPEVPKLDITVSEREGPGYRQGALQLLRRLRPHWRPEEVTLQVGRGAAGPTSGSCGSPSLRRKGRERGRARGRKGGGRAAIVRGSCRLASFPSPSLVALRSQPPAPSPICQGARRWGVSARQHPLPLPALIPHRSLSSSSFRALHAET